MISSRATTLTKIGFVTFAVLRSPLMVKIWGVNDLASDDSRLRILTIGAIKRHLTIGLKVTFVLFILEHKSHTD
jgi:hypothetical protein